MPDVNDLFPSRFLQAADLQGRQPVVAIARVDVEHVGHGQKRETKLVVYFAGKTKGMKLNKTLAMAIARIAGSTSTESWPGVQVRLFAASAKFGADTFPVVRVRPPAVRS